MALEIPFEAPSGVMHPTAYARITKMIIENPAIGPKNICIDVSIYASQTARDARKMPIWGPQVFQVERPAAKQPPMPPPPLRPEVVMECAVDPDRVTLQDCYTWLKGQEKFLEAKDV